MKELTLKTVNGQVLADSREVAGMIDRPHNDLMKTIRSYIEYLGQGDFSHTDFFIESTYRNGQNKKMPHFLITKKGCDMVANKMTGEKGVLFTAAYVTQFEKMERELKEVNKPSYTIEDPIKRAEKWIEEQKEKLMLEQRVAEYEPKVTYYDKILQSKGLVTVSQIAKDYGLSPQKLNKLLHEEGVQYKVSGQWLLYAKHADRGYTKSQSYVDSTDTTRMNTKWTQKGRLFIHQILTQLGYDPDDQVA